MYIKNYKIFGFLILLFYFIKLIRKRYIISLYDIISSVKQKDFSVFNIKFNKYKKELKIFYLFYKTFFHFIILLFISN